MMYQPDHFRVEDVVQIHALMRARPFATLISASTAGLYATHLPTVLKDEGSWGVIECHLARPNPHWKELAAGGEALMIFHGPHGYVTPNWYPSKARNGKAVPTWNYAAAHAYGCPEVTEDKDWLRRHVTALTAQQERDEGSPWSPSDAPEGYIEAMLRGIVGIRFAVTRLEGKWKMSQNRELQDQAGVVVGLRRRGGEDDLEIAEIIADRLTPSG